MPPPGGVTLGKAFVPTTISQGSNSTLTITLSNNNPTASMLTAALTDTLVGGVVIAPIPNASTTCGIGGVGGGVVTAIPGGTTVSLSANSTIPGGAPGTCTVTVTVTASIAGSFLNTLAIGALQVINGATPHSNTDAASAVLIVAATIPTLSEWAMIMLAALLAITGLAAMRRQAR